MAFTSKGYKSDEDYSPPKDKGSSNNGNELITPLRQSTRSTALLSTAKIKKIIAVEKQDERAHESVMLKRGESYISYGSYQYIRTSDEADVPDEIRSIDKKIENNKAEKKILLWQKEGAAKRAAVSNKSKRLDDKEPDRRGHGNLKVSGANKLNPASNNGQACENDTPFFTQPLQLDGLISSDSEDEKSVKHSLGSEYSGSWGSDISENVENRSNSGRNSILDPDDNNHLGYIDSDDDGDESTVTVPSSHRSLKCSNESKLASSESSADWNNVSAASVDRANENLAEGQTFNAASLKTCESAKKSPPMNLEIEATFDEQQMDIWASSSEREPESEGQGYESDEAATVDNYGDGKSSGADNTKMPYSNLESVGTSDYIETTESDGRDSQNVNDNDGADASLVLYDKDEENNTSTETLFSYLPIPTMQEYNYSTCTSIEEGTAATLNQIEAHQERNYAFVLKELKCFESKSDDESAVKACDSWESGIAESLARRNDSELASSESAADWNNVTGPSVDSAASLKDPPKPLVGEDFKAESICTRLFEGEGNNNSSDESLAGDGVKSSKGSTDAATAKNLNNRDSGLANFIASAESFSSPKDTVHSAVNMTDGHSLAISNDTSTEPTSLKSSGVLGSVSARFNNAWSNLGGFLHKPNASSKMTPIPAESGKKKKQGDQACLEARRREDAVAVTPPRKKYGFPSFGKENLSSNPATN